MVLLFGIFVRVNPQIKLSKYGSVVLELRLTDNKNYYDTLLEKSSEIALNE